MLDHKVPGSTSLNSTLLQARLLVVAMLGGMSMFAVFVVLSLTGTIPLGFGTPTGVFATRTPGIAVIGVAVAAIGLGKVLERSMDKNARMRWRDTPDHEQAKSGVARVLVVQTAVRAALAEGAGVLGLVVVILTNDWTGMGAFAVSAITMGSLIASESRFESLVRRVSEVDTFGGMGGPRL